MDKIEIKKRLYKEKPKAYLKYIRLGTAYYYTELDDLVINFEIPVSDMGTADFEPEMDAKLLNRWLILN